MVKKKTGKGGRPKGSKNAATVLREAVEQKAEGVILKEFPKIVRAVCKKAAEGDMRAAKLIMDRIIPVQRAVEGTADKGTGGITIVVQGAEPVKIGAKQEDKSEVIEVLPNGRQSEADES